MLLAYITRLKAENYLSNFLLRQPVNIGLQRAELMRRKLRKLGESFSVLSGALTVVLDRLYDTIAIAQQAIEPRFIALLLPGFRTADLGIIKSVTDPFQVRTKLSVRCSFVND